METNHSTPKSTSDSPRVGVYICYCGGNISDHVDVEKVRELVQRLPEVSVARTNMFMCSDPGQELILEDLKNGTCDRVVVASCSPSLHEGTFRNTILRAGKNPYIYDHANIREQVSWVHHGEAATRKAFHLVAMASAKSRQLEELHPIRVPAKRHATVIGGGVAGLRAAIDLAKNGIEVALLEKTPFLGGHVATLDRLAPTGEPVRTLLEELAAQVFAHPNIRLHGCVEIQSVSGFVGNFTLNVRIDRSGWKKALEALPNRSTLAAGDFVSGRGVLIDIHPADIDDVTLETGALVLATGFRSYRPQPGEYGFGEHPEVVTLSELLSAMQDHQRSDGYFRFHGRRIRSMAMIHCVGSRQIPGIHPETAGGRLNEYCSRTCCTAVLGAANRIRRSHPRTAVYDFYRDIRTYGRDQESLYEETAENGVVFFRFEPEDGPRIEATETAGSCEPMPGRHPASNREAVRMEPYPLTVTVRDTLTFGEEIRTPVDLVVLATGMEPNDERDLVEQLKIPVGNDGFLLEVHPKLRPVELPTRGLLLAGTCQAPMDVGEACNAASAAAVKAAVLLGKGYVELDPFVAQIDGARCDGCGACVEACILEEGALVMQEVSIEGKTERRPVVTPALCLGCGACVAVCPNDAIDVAGWTLRQYEAMVDRIVMEEPVAA
ncbi:MAG: CoB--CoM heterodisulfide reductase iron-sulfur subunit A family protein [Thermodesulfobacteriota bacterium]